MGCSGSQPVPLDQQVALTKSLLGRNVDLSRFAATSPEDLQALKEMQASDIFGGSVFEPIGSADRRGQLRHKNNSLEAEIRAIEVNYLYGGGYYCLR